VNYITTEQDNTRTMEHVNNYITTEQDNTRTMEHDNNYITIGQNERRQRWFGHVLRMDDNRLPRQAIHWDISGSKRKPGRRQKNWIDTIQDSGDGLWTHLAVLAYGGRGCKALPCIGIVIGYKI